MKDFREEFPLGYCAAKFLRQWSKAEEEFYTIISDKPNNEIVGKVLSYFQVARNFAKLKDHPDNLTKIRKALVSVRGDKKLLSEGGKVMALAEIFLNDFGQFNLSASTKLLWLSFRAPYIVHDKRAVSALRKNFGRKFDSRNYDEYANAWRSQYSEFEAPIEQAIQSLPAGRALMPRSPFSDAEIKRLAKKDWFKERVFDMFLWEVGGSR